MPSPSSCDLLVNSLSWSSQIEDPKPLTSRLNPHPCRGRCDWKAPNRKRYTHTDGWHLFATVQYSSGEYMRQKWLCKCCYFSSTLTNAPSLFFFFFNSEASQYPDPEYCFSNTSHQGLRVWWFSSQPSAMATNKQTTEAEELNGEWAATVFEWS